MVGIASTFLAALALAGLAGVKSIAGRRSPSVDVTADDQEEADARSLILTRLNEGEELGLCKNAKKYAAEMHVYDHYIQVHEESFENLRSMYESKYAEIEGDLHKCECFPGSESWCSDDAARDWHFKSAQAQLREYETQLEWAEQPVESRALMTLEN